MSAKGKATGLRGPRDPEVCEMLKQHSSSLPPPPPSRTEPHPCCVQATAQPRAFEKAVHLDAQQESEICPWKQRAFPEAPCTGGKFKSLRDQANRECRTEMLAGPATPPQTKRTAVTRLTVETAAGKENRVLLASSTRKICESLLCLMT